MNHVWHTPRATRLKTLVVYHDQVYAGSAPDDELPLLGHMLADGHSPLPLLGDKAFHFNEVDLHHIEADLTTNDIVVHYADGEHTHHRRVTLPNGDACDRALLILEDTLHLTRSSRQQSPFQAARAPLIGLVLIVLFTVLLGATAADVQAGADVDITGRRRGLKQLFVLTLDLIGPMGVYLVGGLLGALMLYNLVQQITNPARIIFLTPAPATPSAASDGHPEQVEG